MKQLRWSIFYFLILVSNQSSAQWVQTNGPLGGYVYDFGFLDTIVFSANSGALFRSTINGSSWSMGGLPGKNITAIEATPNGSGGMNVYACTSGEGVFMSADSGNTWIPINNGLGSLNTYCLAVTPDGSGGSFVFAGTIGAGIYRTSNNGANWTLAGPSSTTVYDISVLDSNLIAATSSGIYLSTNNGVTWNPAGMSGQFTTAAAILNNPGGNAILFASTYGSGVYRSTDYGITWNPFNTGLLNLYPTDFVVNDTVVYVCLYGQGLFKSALGSTGWTSLNFINNIRTISMYDDGINSMIYMGLDDGTGVYRSPDGASPVLFVDGMINTNIASVTSIYNGAGTSLLYSGYTGEFARIMRSDDLGANWNYSNAYNNMYAIRTFPHNISGTLLITGGLDYGSRLSADSGASWNLCIPDAMWSIAYAPNATPGYDVFAATGSGIFHSVNSGSNWNQINTGMLNVNCRAVCISDTTVFAGTAVGVYMKTINGTLWNNSSTGIPNPDIFSLAAQGIHLFAGTYNSGVYHSVDNGATWTPSPMGVTGLYVSELLFNGSILFAATSSGVFFTDDYGASWSPFNTGLLTDYISDLTVIDSFLVAGTQLGVWIRPLSQVVTGVGSEFSCNTIDCFQIRVFPNPFHYLTSVEFTTRESGHVKAEIFDQQGRLINTIINETLSPGKYNYSWETNNITQGIYLLRVTSALQTQTHRLVRIQ